MATILYHNPRCSTSRNALALLREKGIEPEVVEYLKTGWTPSTLERLARETGLGLRGLLRAKEDGAKALLADGASDADILKAVLAEPILIERPIVETPKGARIGRPVEKILDVL
jgi:arsenate reductase